MLKNISRLELIIGEKFYRFDCEADSDISHCKEALFQFQKYVGMIEDNVKAQQAQVKDGEGKMDTESDQTSGGTPPPAESA